ncbi:MULTISPECIES: hypothetical protein [unclassified Marinovum]
MKRIIASLMVAATLGACVGSTGKDNPFQEDPEDSTGTGDGSTDGTGGTGGGSVGDGVADPAGTVPDELSVNLADVSTPGGNTITVAIQSLDGTPLQNTFTRNAALDTGGYLAYSAQEDALDRMFVALAATSFDNSVMAGVASDGGQFNRYFGGGFYERNGNFTPPEIGNGPGEGQVSYAGRYAAVTNIGTVNGDGLIDVPPNPDPNVSLPDLPREPYRVEGTIFLNANFVDNAVNGEISDRLLINADGGGTTALEDVTLIVAPIDANGEFYGDAEIADDAPNNPGATVGNYGGIFGGDGASSVAGLVRLAGHIDSVDNEIEHGVFVLTQCSQPGDSPICDIVAPSP